MILHFREEIFTPCDREREDLSCKSPSRPKRALSRGTCTPVQRRAGLERGAEKEVGHLGAGRNDHIRGQDYCDQLCCIRQLAGVLSRADHGVESPSI